MLLPAAGRQIEADVTYLKRVTICSTTSANCRRSRPACGHRGAAGGWGAARLPANSVNPRRGRIESNKIGLRTCAKIMAQMSGSFKRYTESGKFTAEVILPHPAAGDPDGSLKNI